MRARDGECRGHRAHRPRGRAPKQLLWGANAIYRFAHNTGLQRLRAEQLCSTRICLHFLKCEALSGQLGSYLSVELLQFKCAPCELDALPRESKCPDVAHEALNQLARIGESDRTTLDKSFTDFIIEASSREAKPSTKPFPLSGRK